MNYNKYNDRFIICRKYIIMNYLLSYMTSATNYKIQNINNVYNLIYDIIKLCDEEKKKEIGELIKKDIGMTFYNNFKLYLMKKNLDIDFE